MNEVFFTTKQVQIVNPKEFVIAVLNRNSKIFVIDIAIKK